ncbi:recombinase family protein [Micromonospora inyonensis]|uniref:Site-specific DNA recombinase n=1 Tax=Micromonospora inyonensis TaxID=47866 RepID=A0A1C6RX09_9ACTN|nr:recombinase family protein [Micromonospora inyonensis]SCL12836.1 Site-specific DNA recombinase [Micromonospora inyonensis]SCL21579.1 Site-specific DNA recombinase [Micromonospora inyonensis]
MPPRRRLAAVPDRPTRAVLYVRVSALMGRGGEDFHSPDVQISAMRRTTHGMTEVAVVEDIDRTGRHFSREGIDRIRRMADAGQIDALAVYDVSRLGRNVRESLAFLAELADKGVTILSANEQVDTSTPAGRLMLTNMLAIAEYRSDEIGRGWSGAIQRRAERGQHHGRPLGYLKEDKRLVPDPLVGPAIAEAFRRYAAGARVGEVTEYLSGVRGVAMTNINVKKLLRNPAYLGKVVAGGEVLQGEHDPLTDEETWRKVQQRLDDEAGAPPRALAYTWALVGLVECQRGHKLQKQGNRLVCGHGRGDTKGGDCPGVGRPIIALVEEETLRQVAAYAAKLRTDAGVRASRAARIDSARVDRDRLEKELNAARAAMVKLATSNALSQLPDEVYQKALGELTRIEQSAAAELARLAPVREAPAPEAEAAMVDTLLGLWPDMTNQERSRALRAVVDRVEVRAAERWRQPESERIEVHFRW